MSEIYENETMETEVLEGTVEDTENESGNKLGLAAVVVGLGALAVGGTVAAVKALKNKKADRPKKQKTKLKLVRVPVEEKTEEPIVEESEEKVEETATEK